MKLKDCQDFKENQFCTQHKSFKIKNHSKRDDTTEPYNTEISMTLQPFTDVLSDV